LWFKKLLLKPRCLFPVYMVSSIWQFLFPSDNKRGENFAFSQRRHFKTYKNKKALKNQGLLF